MFYISIVDFDKSFRSKVATNCKKILSSNFKMQSAISTFDSMADFFRLGKSIQYSDILIINTECIKGSKECFLNVLGEVQNMFRMHVMFYGENAKDILLIYRVRHFYFILKNTIDEMLPKALRKGIEKIISENKKISITYNCKTDVLNMNEIISVKKERRILAIKTLNENFKSYSRKNIKELLNSNLIQISYNFLISLQWIQSYNKEFIHMAN